MADAYVGVLVAKLLNSRREVTEEDYRMELFSAQVHSELQKQLLTNIALADLLRDLNVRTVDRPEQQTTVQAELHVRRTGRFCTSGRDVLAEVRCWNEDFREGDGVVGDEEHGEVVLGVWVDIDDAGDVDDEFDCLKEEHQHRCVSVRRLINIRA